ncbi:hypothetical protein ICJ84_09125 [Aestuariibaculum suncheonense]|uniref:Co-chaperone DjlA N-terminal domain-containing protein n=2 Tax=Aestuariibaculum suncheonense TaxID=1028745 RepID=A0A8J6Q7F4_9FLAO|nr:hypothetical protein [Aestuariibaculum suncheonense]
MKTQMKMTHKLYQNLGKLFYAMASADDSVNKAEFDKLKVLVKKHWLNLDNLEDDYGSDAAYEIEIVFDWLKSQKYTDNDRCFNDFVAYKNSQPHLFTPKLKKLILKTANAIAAAFSGINKSELIMMAKLDLELKK